MAVLTSLSLVVTLVPGHSGIGAVGRGPDKAWDRRRSAKITGRYGAGHLHLIRA